MMFAALISLASRRVFECLVSVAFSAARHLRRRSLLLLWLALFALPAHAVDYIYWTDINSGTQGIRRADLSGVLPLTPQDVATSADGLQQPHGIDVDVTGGKVYWTDPYAGVPIVQKLQRMNMDGSGAVEDLRTGLNTPQGVAVDTVNGKVYWVDSAAETINRANLDGSTPETLLTMPGSAPVGIALDVAGGKMYWTNSGQGRVERGNLDGSSVEILVAGLTSPKGIDLDLANRYIYWATGNLPNSEVRRANMADGSGNTQIITTASETIYDVAIHVAANQIYWISGSTVRRSNLSPIIPQTVVSGVGVGRGIALVLTPATYTISGRVFNDANFNGTAATYDGGLNDVALQNVDVELYSSSNAYIASTTTAVDGTYSFTGLAIGTYKVRARTASISGVPELAWAKGAALYGGQDPSVDDRQTADNGGPGDTYVSVPVAGASAANVDFGFAYNLIVNTIDTTTANQGQGSLRQFLTNATSGVLGSGNLTSQFRIPLPANQSSGADNWWRIAVNNLLPLINTANLVLDGGTQTANIGDTNTRGPEIELTGGVGCVSCNGIWSNAAGVTINQFSINTFDLNGINVTSLATGNVITGNYIGINAIGTTPQSNSQDGIFVQGANVTIGGTGAGQGNVISGNGGDGIQIDGAANSNIVGNTIGVNAIRTAAVGNAAQGVNFTNTSSGVVGGTTAAHANVIGGNSSGIRLGGSSIGITVQGNYIGTNAGGTNLGQTNYGIIATTTGSGTLTIGGTASGAGNVIRYNGVATYTDAANATTTVAGNIVSNQTVNAIYVFNGTALIQKNLVYNNDATAIYLNNGANSFIVQNTAHNNNGHGISIATAASSVTVRNNITSNNGTVSGFGVNDPNNRITSLSNNLYYNNFTGACSGTACPGANSVVLNPQYTNTAGGDFSLQCGSPALDSGADLGGNQPDMNGVSAGLFNGNGPDIGALESDCSTVRIVNTTVDAVSGSLRTQLTNAVSGDTIRFSPAYFDPASPATITLIGNLAAMATGGVTIDASNSGVRVSGNNLYQCFNITSNNNVIKGLRIQGCTTAAITLSPGANNNTIGGDNTVGSGPSGEGNIIVSNSSGILINTANSNTVTGNYIGTDPASTLALGNTGIGINISTGQSNTIGGATAGLRNVIASNGSYGVSIQNASATLNRVIGNYIGTNVAGTAAMANSFGVGVVTSTTANTIGGTAAGERNVISGNTNIGVNISGASNNVVEGNFIGIGSDGVTPVPNGTGLAISALGSGNTIGGTAASAGNVISGNGGDGISITASSDSVIQGNYIGTDSAATVAVPNGGRGITINTSSSGNIIGGTVANSANVIAGNTLQGIRSTATGTNTIVGNFIGTNSAMTTLPNGGAIAVTSGTINIGDASEVQANVLSSSGGTGLSITGGTVNLAGTIDLDGHLTTTAGTLNMGSAAVYFSGGSWNNNNSLTVNPGTSTFTLDGTVTQSITTGSLASWNNFVITNSGTITFQDGFSAANVTAASPSTWINFSGAATYNISGTLTLNGQAAGTRIRLRSTTASRAILNLTGSPQYVYYVDVQDSEVTGNNLYAYNSTNTGNTDSAEAAPHWIFGTARIVNSALDSGAGTLREALSLAVSGDTIAFNASTFPIGASTTISLASALNVTQGGIVIDAASADVRLSGGGTLATCLQISSSNNVVRGLHIQNCATNGIYVSSGTNNTIGGDRSTGSGPSGQGNTLVSNGTGIRVDSALNFIYGNYIGTDGTSPLPNNMGVALYGSANIIGGSGTGLRNVISGNNGNGITVFSTSTANTIQGNYIGTNSTGSGPIANSVHGIELSNSPGSNIIGGAGAGEGNVLSGNTWSGILLDDSNSNTIAGNIIGANAAATAALPNGASGIEISTTSAGNTIGSTAASAGNVISGNTGDGIRHAGSGANAVYGNFIGTNSSAASLPNGSDGIEVFSVGSITLGDAAESQSNVIGPNAGFGINLTNGAITLAGTVDVNDDVSLSGGTLNMGAATLQVSGNWNKGSGTTLNAGTSMLTLDGSSTQNFNNNTGTYATIAVTNASVGGVTFQSALTTTNLTATTASTRLTFAGGAIFTVSGTLNLNGQATGTRIQLRSTTTSQYTFDVTGGAQTVRFVDVQYGAASGNDINALNSLDSGNNDNGTGSPQWIFSATVTVNSTADSGAGSLRDALLNQVTGDTIVFDPATFPPGAPVTLTLSGGNLPAVSAGSVTLDASNAGVVINGTGTTGACLTINSANNTVKGLTIQNCVSDGILLSSGAGNIIGGDRTTGAGPNGEGNTVVSNGSDGIQIDAASAGNFLYGNYIGTDGAVALSNTANGLNILSSTNTVGDFAAGLRNVISGNGGRGVLVGGGNGNLFRNNYIGVNATATAAIANTSHGIDISSASNPTIIGWMDAGAGNVISGNGGSGVYVHNSSAVVNIFGNFIGTNSTGDPLPNTAMGLRLESATVYLGNATEVQPNVIGPNGGVGIYQFFVTSQLFLGGTIDVNDDVSFNSGTLSLGSATLQVAGNFEYSFVSVYPGTSTVVLDGTAAQLVNMDTQSNLACEHVSPPTSTCFNNLTVTNNSAPVTFTSAALDSSLTATNFTATTPGTQLVFRGGSNNTITGTLDLNGQAAGTRITLDSTNASQYTFNVTGGPQRVSYVNVQDAVATTNNIIAAASVDSGNNGTGIPQWLFSDALWVTTTADGGAGSLRQALTDAVNGNFIYFDSVVFPAAGPAATITPVTALPSVTQGAVMIDASNAGVVINGGALPAATDCLVINSSGNTVKGLRIQDCANDAIRIGGGTGNTIGGSSLAGTGPSGEGNVLVANGGDGIHIDSGGNFVYGNYIGTDSAGTPALGNVIRGVFINVGAQSNTIGGSGAGQRNVISGNPIGVAISGATTQLNVVAGNYIGTDVAGSGALGNTTYGVYLYNSTHDNTVGGTTAAAGNVISGNAAGVLLDSANNNTIAGNAIGTNAARNGALPNNQQGIRFINGATGNTVGSLLAGAGNVVAGNTQDGIAHDSAGSNTLLGNFVGNNGAGIAIANGGNGVVVNSGTVELGNASEAQPHIIGPNTGYGIDTGAGSTLNLAGTVDINDDVRNTASTVNLGTATINLSGNWANNGATHNVGTSVLVLDGTAAQSVSAGLQSFYDVTVTNASAAVTFSAINAVRNLTATQPSSQLTFTGGSTLNIGGTLDLNGQGTATRIQLRSTNISQYTLNVTAGTQTVRYVDVQYGAASGNDINALNSLDSGNNDNGTGSPQWVFGAARTATTTADTGAGSLRDALTNASSGDTITFDTAAFPPGAPATISLGSALPGVTQGSITIDASDAGVVIDGGGVAVDCMTIASNNNVVRGLRIQNCTGNGITISSGTNNTIGGDRTVGAGPNGQGNTIVSNGSNGVHIEGSQTFIYGNYIGTDGSAGLGNGTTGLSLFNSNNNVIGAATIGQRNVISGNNSRGINVQNSNSNTIRNNYIGTNAAGTAGLANLRGIMLEQGSSNNIIGGSGAGEGNLLSGNATYGITLANNGTGGNSVLGNTIGTNALRTAALPNGFAGVTVESGAIGNTIGGTTSGAGNVIAGNGQSGIVHSTTNSNSILGNFVGNNGSGTGIANGGDGITVSGGTVTLGNAGEVQVNVIGPNTGDGIRLSGGALALAGAATVNDSVQLDAGTTLTLGTSTLSVAGNWTNNGATIVPGTSTVVLGGTGQSISGDSAFYNLIKTVSSNDTLTFADGSVQTIGGALTLTGTGGATLTLRSVTPGTAWNLTLSPGATHSVQVVDVRDSNAGGGLAITAVGSTDSGNNVNWVFPAAAVVSSLFAEVSPNAVGYGATNSGLTVDLLPTLVMGDVGFDRIDLALPTGWTNGAATAVSVGGSALTMSCPTPAAGTWCASGSGASVTVTLGSAVSTTATNVRVTLSADAPAAMGSNPVAVSVINTATIYPAVIAAAGNADGDATDANALGVAVQARAMTSALAEISPIEITAARNGTFTLDTRLTFGAGDSGVDQLSVTLPSGYSNTAVTAASVNNVALTESCPTPGAGQFCPTVAAQVLNVQLGDRLTTDQIPLQLVFTMDAPPQAGATTLNVAFDDSATLSVAPNAIAGDADGDGADANTLTVSVLNAVESQQSSVDATPQIVLADGVSAASITITLRDVNRTPMPNKTVQLDTDRNAIVGVGMAAIVDTITQPAAVTDTNGVTGGTVVSAVPGAATVTATETGDNIAVAQRAIVYFTQGRVLEIDKTAAKTEAVIGDVVTYNIELRNTTAQDVVQVQVVDRLPPNFKYVDGSARVNGAAISVSGDTRTRVFDVGTIAALADTNGNGRADPGESGYSKLTYQLIVGSGAQPGSYTNTAVARDVCDACLISNEDDARVAVTLDPLLDLGTIVGKVFEDRNRDGRQDDGEPGIGGAMVALDDGTYVLTDEHGRYHLPAVRPGQRVVKLNLQALSDYAQSTSDAAQVVALTPGLLAKANFGVMFAPDTQRIGRPPQYGVQIESASTPEPLQVQGDVNNLAVLLNGQRVGLPEGDATMNISLLDGVLIDGDRLAQSVEFALSAREPKQVRRWTLVIAGRDGTPLRRYSGERAPPPAVNWDGRDDQGRLLRGGSVYMYWLELEYEDGASAISARRNFGMNKQTAVNLNLTGGAFVTGSAQLTDDAKKILKDVARTLREYPDEVIFIEGHTDSTGSADINQKLSADRAQAARDYLVKSESIPFQRFVVRGYGATRPLADNDSEEGRELNRRIEIHGEVSSVDRARLLDQYRAAPEVRINGQPMAIDANGRFKANLDDAQELNVEAVDRQGRTARGRLAIPPLERLEPTGRSILAYGTDTLLYRVPEANGGSDDILAYHVVQGHTTPGSRVTFDGQESVADANGVFRLKVPLRRGVNRFGIMVRNSQDAVRIAQVRVDVTTHTSDGRQLVALQPVPNLTVQLPHERQQLRSAEITVSGATDAGNRVTVNGQSVSVQPDGRFTVQVTLPKGKSNLTVIAEDQEGNQGLIEREVDVGDEQLFLIAIADAKFGELRGSGRLEGSGLEQKREYYREGRVAYYMKGRVAGKYLVRSAYDSGETGFNRMFRDLDEGQEQRLLANLDPDKLYPVYGDDSTLVHDAQSLGKFYLAVDSDELSALIGNFPLDLSESELAAYRRTFYGARIAWQSLARSPYGAPTTRALVFGAEIREVHVRDALRATGGALYYLSRREVIEGSEQIAIVVRDKDTGLPRSRTVQSVNVDYTINYDQGRILFTRPLASVSGDGALIDQNVLGGHPVYIEADYEARADAFEKSAQGARVRQQLGDHVAVGATAVSDDLAAGRYELGGVDAELRIRNKTRVLVEAASSSGGATPLNESKDGGLSFATTTPVAGSEGQAWKAAVNVDVNDFVQLPVDVQAGAYVKKTGDGFQSAGHDANNAGTRTGVHVVAGEGTADKITLRHEQDDLTQNAEPASLSMAQWQHNMDRWQVTTEVQARNGANAGSGDDATLGAAQLKFKHNDKVTSRIEHQHTLDGARNNQSTVGAELRLTERLDVDGSVTSATDGDSAQATASWRIGNGRAYVSERALDSRAGASTVTVVGGESAVGERSRVYSEYQWERQPDSERGVSVVGTQTQWEPAQGWLMDASGEHGAVNASLHNTQRYALALGVAYRSQRGWRVFTREEYRKEWGTSDTHQWLTVNGVEVKLNPDYTVLGKYRRSRTVNDNTGGTVAGFDERSIGLVYRPVATDTFNALTRYTVLDERPPLAAPGDTPVDERSEVVSAEWSWDFSRWAEWVDKQAFKTKRYDTVGGPATTTHTWLSIHRLNVHVHASVDAGLEFRTLTQREADDRRSGWLVELSWKVAKHVRIGAGYNFTDFSDNEFSDNDYSVRGRFVRVQAVY